MPLRFVLPSAASANIVSRSDSNCRAGTDLAHELRDLVARVPEAMGGVPAGDGEAVAGYRDVLLAANLEADAAAEDLEALLLRRVDVRCRDEAAGLDEGSGITTASPPMLGGRLVEDGSVGP